MIFIFHRTPQRSAEGDLRQVGEGPSDTLLSVRNIEKTKFNLIKNNINIIKSSSYYESLSWPNPKNPKFLNIVLKIKTNFSPIKLIRKCKDIEKEIGRKKSPKNSPRECDIDIINYGNRKMSGKLVLPHPRMHIRNFVLFPLFENSDKKLTSLFKSSYLSICDSKTSKVAIVSAYEEWAF